MEYPFSYLCTISALHKARLTRFPNIMKGISSKRTAPRNEAIFYMTMNLLGIESVTFKKEQKGKKERFKPKDIAGYKVADKVYHTVQFQDIPFKNTKFLMLEKEGCLNMYSYRTLSEGAWSTVMILKNDKKAINTQNFIMGYADKMADLVKEDQELAAKIKNKEKGYSLLNIEAIVDEYNSNCKK